MEEKYDNIYKKPPRGLIPVGGVYVGMVFVLGVVLRVDIYLRERNIEVKLVLFFFFRLIPDMVWN